MIEGKWFVQGSDLTQPLAIREAVFGRGMDALDAEAQQVMVYREGQPVGAARLWRHDGSFHMGDIGVLPAYRGQGYGDLLVRLLIFKAETHHAGCVRLTCAQATRAFFERYGFAASDNGDPLEMSLRPGEGCAGCGHCGK